MATDFLARPTLRREIMLALGIDCADAQPPQPTPAPQGAMTDAPGEDDLEYARRLA